MNPNESFLERYALPILIAGALFVQLLGRYHAHEFKIGHFYYSWILLRIVIPIVILSGLKIPFSKIGLRLPPFDGFLIGLCLASLGGFLGIYLLIHASPQYLGYYAQGWGALNGDRLFNFMIFTLSTLTGWEFLHRSFLLMGIVCILTRNKDAGPEISRRIAVLTVWIFEVLFHFTKPQMEATGMLLGSPVLSYITLKTGSIWPAFLIHLGVEIVFILSF